MINLLEVTLLRGRGNIAPAFFCAQWLLLQVLSSTLSAEQQKDNRQRLGK
jgi:hypothetical protein